MVVTVTWSPRTPALSRYSCNANQRCPRFFSRDDRRGLAVASLLGVSASISATMTRNGAKRFAFRSNGRVVMRTWPSRLAVVWTGARDGREDSAFATDVRVAD